MPRPYRQPPKYGRQPIQLLIFEHMSTVRELADALDIDYSHLVRATGGRCRPHPGVIARLCDHFECGPSDLFTPQALAASTPLGRS